MCEGDGLKSRDELPLISPLHWRDGLRPRIATVLGGVGSLGDIVSA